MKTINQEGVVRAKLEQMWRKQTNKKKNPKCSLDNFKWAAWLKAFIKIHDVFKFPFLAIERISLKQDVWNGGYSAINGVELPQNETKSPVSTAGVHPAMENVVGASSVDLLGCEGMVLPSASSETDE